MHYDSENEGIDAILTLGCYDGGFLCLPSLGLVIATQPNSLVLLNSKELPHLNTEVTAGERFSFVGFSHRSHKKHLGAQKVTTIDLTRISPFFQFFEFKEETSDQFIVEIKKKV